HLIYGEQLAGQLVGLPDRDGWSIAVDHEHDAEMDLRHRRRVLVQETEQPRLERALIDDLLLPLPFEPVKDRIAGPEVARVDMAADAQRILLAQAPLG